MLADRLSEELKVAMKERAADRVGLIRLLLADLKNARIRRWPITADDDRGPQARRQHACDASSGWISP
jgi:uncharacterized protein YqeY